MQHNFPHKFIWHTLLHLMWNFPTSRAIVLYNSLNLNSTFCNCWKCLNNFSKKWILFTLYYSRTQTTPFWNHKERNTLNLYTSSRINCKNWRVMPTNQEMEPCHPMFFWKDKELSWVSDYESLKVGRNLSKIHVVEDIVGMKQLSACCSRYNQSSISKKCG